jgi:hypothetical protein
MLTSTEQNELHNLLRQQGNLTQDGCWDAIEVFEEFLKEKLKPLSNIDIKEASRNAKDISFYNGVKWAERQHGIGADDE